MVNGDFAANQMINVRTTMSPQRRHGETDTMTEKTRLYFVPRICQSFTTVQNPELILLLVTTNTIVVVRYSHILAACRASRESESVHSRYIKSAIFSPTTRLPIAFN